MDSYDSIEVATRNRGKSKKRFFIESLKTKKMRDRKINQKLQTRIMHRYHDNLKNDVSHELLDEKFDKLTEKEDNDASILWWKHYWSL